MAEDSEFLKKVYDKYLNSDFSYGTSNLNPKREISKEDIEDAKSLEAKIIEEIERQFNELKSDSSKIINYKENKKEEDFKTDFNLGGFNNNPESPVYYYVPGIPSDSDNSPLLRDIRKLILQLIPYLPETQLGKLDGTGDEDSLFNISKDSVLKDLYETGVLVLDCEGITYSDLRSSIKDSKNNENVDTKENSDVDDESESDESESSNSSINSADDNVEGNEKAAADDRSLLAVCAIRQLSILAIILSIVRVVSVLKKVLSMVLSTLIPVVKIVARCASCWVDPPAAAEAAQLVAEKVAAMIISLTSQLLQMLWNMLNLDCLTSVIQSVLNQINQAIAGINQLSSIGSQISMMAGGAIKETKAAVQAIKDFNSDEFKNKLKEHKDKFEESLTSARQEFEERLSGKAIANSIIPQGAKDLARKAKELGDSVSNLGKSAMSAEARMEKSFTAIYDSCKTMGSN